MAEQPPSHPAKPGNVQIARPRPCPVCQKPEDINFRPFCSKRCADVDLHRWLNGGYAIPAADDEDEESSADRDERQ